MYARQCVHRLEKGVDRMDDGGPTASIPLFLALLLIEALCYGFGAAIHGLNEKEVENVIYSYLRPLMEQAVGGEAAGYQEIGEVLENLQAELLKISK